MANKPKAGSIEGLCRVLFLSAIRMKKACMTKY